MILALLMHRCTGKVVCFFIFCYQDSCFGEEYFEILFLVGKVDESRTLTMTARRNNDSGTDLRGYGEQTLLGLDTLEEIADKENFFSNLAMKASGTLDFSKLNKILDESLSDKEER